MPDTVKLPAIGPVKKTWVYVGGALIVGIVGYAWYARAGGGGGAVAPEQPIPEDYSDEFLTEGREPPPTVVGGGSYDQYGVGAVINTNTEWFTAAVMALSDVGYNPLTAAQTLGKFLQRQQLTAEEVTLVQAAKGYVGEPPQGGPWPIMQAPAAAPPSTSPPSSGPSPHKGSITGAHGTRLTANTRLIDLAKRYAALPNHPDSVEATKRWILTRNPFLIARGKNRNNSIIPKGWIIIVPTRSKVA